MIVLGLTGGIASGKTTITNFLKKKKFAVHDSDIIVKNIYSKLSPSFKNYLKSINLEDAIKGTTVNKNLITPLTESFQAIIWHCLVSHPLLQKNKTKW